MDEDASSKGLLLLLGELDLAFIYSGNEKQTTKDQFVWWSCEWNQKLYLCYFVGVWEIYNENERNP